MVEVRGLKVFFPITAGVLRRQVGQVKAVDDVSFDIMHGETLGLVGESGCGKTTAGRAILRLTPITGGSITVDGTEITQANDVVLHDLRPRMQMIFQDPQASLNPRMTVAGIIAEPLIEHERAARKQRLDRVYELMDAVGLNRDWARQVSARVFRRPAAADWHRQSPCPEPETDHL